MLSSVALRAQIASIINALSEAAVAEISKVVEDGMVVLRLETCQRETEIQKLKSNIEVLHGELRSLQGGESLRADDSQRAVGGERSLLENGPAHKNHNHADHNGPSMPEGQVQVKCEPVEEGSEENRGRPAQPGDGAASYDGDGAPWRPEAAAQMGRNNCGYLNVGQNSLPCLPDSSLSSSSAGFQHSPFSRGLLGYSQHRNSYGNSYSNSYSAVRRRTAAAAKRFMFKKGFVCPYCGKYFERAGHLERHKRIHTGEKPYRCEVCGRRFNQNCSLKEHLKIHGRCVQPKPPEMEVAEQKPAPEGKPCPDAPRPEEAAQGKAVDVLPETEDLLAAPVRVKREPAEENIAPPPPPPPFLGGGEQTRDGGGGGDLGENFATFVSDSQQWASRLQSQSNAEIGGGEYLGGGVAAAQSTASFPGMAQLLPPALDASCSTFSFPGKPYGELNGSAASQAPYGSSDTLLLPGDAGSHGTPLDPHRPRGSRSFQVIKPKKFFVCSYCGKVFERVGHLERHLRIHTGEKPYGCHVCGRCFNQKSSLKGHMKTHRNGENTDVLDPHHLMFTMPDNQPSKNPAEPKTGLAALEEQLLGAAAYTEAVGEQTVMVKLEPGGEDFLTPSQPASGGGADRSRLWTPGNEESGGPDQTVRVLLHDAKYHLAGEPRGYTPPAGELPFLGAKEQEEIMHNGRYAPMAVHSGRSLAPEPSANEYAAASDGPHGGGGFEFNMDASGSHVDDCGAGAAAAGGGQNCFICSTCGQSFDCFGSFQRHQCANIPEQSFSCEICGEPFTQMSVLKLHLKLHVE